MEDAVCKIYSEMWRLEEKIIELEKRNKQDRWTQFAAAALGPINGLVTDYEAAEIAIRRADAMMAAIAEREQERD